MKRFGELNKYHFQGVQLAFICSITCGWFGPTAGMEMSPSVGLNIGIWQGCTDLNCAQIVAREAKSDYDVPV